MKIFVSGQINDIANVRNVQQKLIQAGHNITHDWTRNETGDKMLASPEDKLKDPAETGRRAELDIDGVINADAYVICTDNQECGKGMYVELGAALALNRTTGKPKVFLVGKMNHMSVFYFHPAVRRFNTVEEVIEQLT
ncbi:MAG TPA: hypothetical protein VK978_04010 [Candidatus Saccharimonadales bacterium]|nr:hypothetical protein [Candidatus Saccharimonadales bacterium]